MNLLLAMSCHATPVAAAEPPAPAPAPLGAAGPTKLPELPRSTSPRPTDCVLQLEDLSPLLADEQPGLASRHLVRDPWRLVEHLRFDDGVEVRVVQSGCAHYGQTWQAAPAIGADPVAAARAAFARVRTRDRLPRPILALDAGPVADPKGFACGDAWCTLGLEGEVVTFLYDFPL